MFSTSCVNVLGFDPECAPLLAISPRPLQQCAARPFSNMSSSCQGDNGNTDQARAYASKYCSKPERWCAARDSRILGAIVMQLHYHRASCSHMNASIGRKVLHGNDAAEPRAEPLQELVDGTNNWASIGVESVTGVQQCQEYPSSGVHTAVLRTGS